LGEIQRQAEYQPYVNQLGVGIVHQGILTDPYYFDFISYAQYRTINREISQNPPMIYEEQQPIEDITNNNSNNNNNNSNNNKNGNNKSNRIADMSHNSNQVVARFVTRVVRRDPLITNDRLASEHSRLVGDLILSQFDEWYGNTPSALPTASDNAERGFMDSCTLDAVTCWCWHNYWKKTHSLFLYRSNCVSNEAQVLMALTQLVNLFLINGFAWDGSTALRRPSNSILSASGSEYCLTLVSPATIWGGHALSREKAVVCNNFL
jgi:hypothetical protein